MTEDQLEAALRDLGARIDVPEPPDVTAAVRARLSAEPRPLIVRRPILAAALAILAAFALAFAVSPEVRAGVEYILKFAGIEFRDDPPPEPLPTPVVPGERTVSLEEARKIASFEIKVPGKLGTPKEVRVTDRVVTLVYDNARVDEIDGRFGIAMGKFAHGDDIERLQIDGSEALWIPRPHEVLYVDRDGNWQSESARLSGSTLIWQDGRLTMRLEGTFTRDEAVAIATGN
jgi:hypothetical protein